MECSVNVTLMWEDSLPMSYWKMHRLNRRLEKKFKLDRGAVWSHRGRHLVIVSFTLPETEVITPIWLGEALAECLETGENQPHQALVERTDRHAMPRIEFWELPHTSPWAKLQL